MNVALIYPRSDVPKRDRFGYSLLLLRLGTLLKCSGHIARYFDLSVENSTVIGNIIDWGEVFVVEMDAFPLRRSANVFEGERVIAAIRRCHPKSSIIALGLDLLLFPRVVPGASYSICGCPFDIILDLIVPNRNNRYPLGLISVPQGRSFQALPSPDYQLIQWDSALVERRWGWPIQSSAIMETSKGCPGNCLFCQRKSWAPRPETRDLVSFSDELLSLARLNVRNIWFSDDNFGFSSAHVKSICERILALGLGGTFNIAISSWAKFDLALLDLAFSAGIRIISIGIESSNREILKFYRKPCITSEVRALIEEADRKGIFTVGNFILGAPQESIETFEESLNFAMSLPIDQINVKHLNYMAGSDLYEALPINLRQNHRSVFACMENGLCPLSMAQLKALSAEFQNRFSAHQSQRVKAKVKRFGPPFALVTRA